MAEKEHGAMTTVSEVATKWLKDKGMPLYSQEELSSKLNDVERKAQIKAAKDYLKLKRRVYSRDSLWPSGNEITFSFERWDPNMQKDVKHAQAIKDKAFHILEKMDTKNINVMLAGNAGTGKTAMALAMLDSFNKFTDRTTMFVSSVSLRELVMHDFNDIKASDKLARVKKSMIDVDVLVIDDFGSEVGMSGNGKQATERLQQFYMRIADARFETDKDGNRTKSNIITTNNTRDELNSMYNEKLLSRLVTKRNDNILIFANMEDMRE